MTASTEDPDSATDLPFELLTRIASFLPTASGDRDIVCSWRLVSKSFRSMLPTYIADRVGRQFLQMLTLTGERDMHWLHLIPFNLSLLSFPPLPVDFPPEILQRIVSITDDLAMQYPEVQHHPLICTVRHAYPPGLRQVFPHGKMVARRLFYGNCRSLLQWHILESLSFYGIMLGLDEYFQMRRRDWFDDLEWDVLSWQFYSNDEDTIPNPNRILLLGDQRNPIVDFVNHDREDLVRELFRIPEFIAEIESENYSGHAIYDQQTVFVDALSLAISRISAELFIFILDQPVVTGMDLTPRERSRLLSRMGFFGRVHDLFPLWAVRCPLEAETISDELQLSRPPWMVEFIRTQPDPELILYAKPMIGPNLLDGTVRRGDFALLTNLLQLLQPGTETSAYPSIAVDLRPSQLADFISALPEPRAVYLARFSQSDLYRIVLDLVSESPAPELLTVLEPLCGIDPRLFPSDTYIDALVEAAQNRHNPALIEFFRDITFAIDGRVPHEP